MTTPARSILHSPYALATGLFLLVGCGSSSSTAVDTGVDGPRASTDGAPSATPDLASNASHDGALEALAIDGATSPDGAPGNADAPVQVDVYVPAVGADAGIPGSPDLSGSTDLVLPGNSYDTSAPRDAVAESPSPLDGSSSIDSASGKAVDAAASDSRSGVVADVASPVDLGNDATTGPGNKIGVIALSETSQTIPGLGAIVASGAQATFGFQAGTSACTSTTKGDCQLFVCPTSSNPTTTPTFLQAGTVTVTGLAMDVPLTLKQGTTGATYMSASYSSYLWTSSRAATVEVTGSADVPAFTMNLTAPSPITVTSPLPSSTMTYTISRSSDVVVTWSGGVDGTAQVNLSSNSSGATQSLSITCSVDASKGTVTVPASLMSGFASSGGFVAAVYNSATKNVGDWLMEFQATQQTGAGTVTFTN